MLSQVHGYPRTKKKNYCPFPDPIPKDFENLQSDLNRAPAQDWIIYEVTCIRTHGQYILKVVNSYTGQIT